MSRGLINISLSRADNKDEVLGNVQIGSSATLDFFRREIAAKLGTDPHIALQVLFGERFLLGPGTLKEFGLSDGCTVGVQRKRGLVVTGSADHTGMVCDCKSGKTTYVLRGHTDALHSATFSPDNRFIATGSQDMSAKIWTLENGSCVATLEEHKGPVVSTSFSADGSLVATASFDKTAKVWRLPVGMAPSSATAAASEDKDARPECILTVEGHSEGVFSVVFTPSGKFLATGSMDGTAKVWGVADGTCWATMKGHEGAVHSVAFSPDSQLVLTASIDRTAKVWNANSGAIRFTLSGHTGHVQTAAFSQDGAFIVTSSRDRTAKVWCARTGECLHTLKGHADALYAASFSQNGKFVVTGSADATTKVWALKDNAWTMELNIEGHRDGVRAASFNSV